MIPAVTPRAALDAVAASMDAFDAALAAVAAADALAPARWPGGGGGVDDFARLAAAVAAVDHNFGAAIDASIDAARHAFALATLAVRSAFDAAIYAVNNTEVPAAYFAELDALRARVEEGATPAGSWGPGVPDVN